MMRSWLFVPATSETKLSKAPKLGADVIVVDLEDAVAGDGKAAARTRACEFIDTHRTKVARGRGFSRWVRINGLDTPHWREDLVAVMPGAPDGIIMPKATGPEQVQLLAAEVYELEQRNRIAHETVQIIPQIGETPAAALAIPQFLTNFHPRIGGFSWGAEDLMTSLGGRRKKDEHGHWTDPMRHVRTQVLLMARARGLIAVETVHSDFRDLDGLEQAARAARGDGFTGMLAIHPAQVPAINMIFSPSEAELAEAREIVALFEANPGAGALGFRGRMVEKPHLEQAKRLLDLA